ncbi:IS5 family transposase, partial [Bradyrhizobium frederickii]|uniref:IS5 family transposase n=2 Tax=Bradyrhizobium TaxID=374 RepID=UPI001F1CCB14
MRPKERRDSGQADLLRSRLDAIIDMNHALVKLSRTIDWSFLAERFGAVYEDKPGRPPLPTRLMAGLAILKHTYDLSDEVLCERWVENPYYQFFCGEEFFQHRLVFDRSSLTRWRQRMGEEKLQALLQESLSVATKTKAIKPSDLNRVIVDTTVQPKNVMFPTDARLLNRAREILVRLAKGACIKLRQSYGRIGKFALIKHQRYAHAKQFKRANRALRTLRTYLGRVIRDIGRKLEGNVDLLHQIALDRMLILARRVLDQKQHQRGPKVYSLHAPEVECIGKGKAHRPYELMAWTTPAPSGNVESGGATAGAQAMSNTNIVTIGIDLGKNTFHVVGLDTTGAITLRKKRSRNQLDQSLANVPRCLIGMEACAGAHHLGRKLEKFGH